MKHYFYIFLAIKLQVYLMCHFVRRETRHLVSVRERERERSNVKVFVYCDLLLMIVHVFYRCSVIR